MLFVAAWYSTNSKRSKIICFYRGRDKTLETKWINVTDNFIIFRNKKFYVDTRRMISFWYKGGIHFIFPTKVNSLEYNWSSVYPHDPDDYKVVWETPETRKVLLTEEWVKSYGRGFTPQTTKKQGLLMQYLPFITILLLVIFAFWVYSNFNGIANSLNDLANKINTIAK